MNEATSIQYAIEEFFLAIDEKRWSDAENLMTDPIHIDYSSYGGGDPADLSPSDILSAWKTILPGFDVTHHQIGQVSIDKNGSEANARAHVTAAHYIADAEGGNLWTVYGSYDLSVKDIDGYWKLSKIKFNFKFVTGNLKLPELAQKRA